LSVRRVTARKETNVPSNLVSLSRPEWIADIPFVAVSPQTLPTRGGILPSDFYYWGLLIEVEGRVTVGVADADALRDGAQANIIERIEIQGMHRVRRQQELFYSVRGADVMYLQQFYTGADGAQTPVTTLTQTAKDFRQFYLIPFPPERIPLAQQAAYLLDAPNYDTLVPTIFWGDGSSIFNPAATTTFAFAPFGGGAGAPRARVHGIFASFGQGGAPGFVPARVWRYFTENTVQPVTAQADARLFNLNRGYTLRSLYYKQGTRATVADPTTAGVNVYNTLSDVILADIKVMRGTNKQIRNYIDLPSLSGYNAFLLGQELGSSVGVGLIDFSENGDILTALDTQGMVAGPTGDVDLFLQGTVVAGAANQACLMVTQEIRGVPVGLIQ
jgi:hypothetical protein